jgi:peptide/nickel transport system substrate-binding protein
MGQLTDFRIGGNFLKKNTAKILGILLLAAMISNYFVGPPVRAQAPASGGTPILSLYFDIDSLNPFTMSADTAFIVTGEIYETLFVVLNNGTYYPDLATSWSISPDALTYTFNLRHGVTWQDGQPFTSDDVKYTFELALNNSALSNDQLAVTGLKSVETPDNYTVVFHLSTPLVPFQMYAGYDVKIVPRHIWQTVANPATYINDNPIGTGPFMFDSRTPGQQIVLKSYDNYWGGRPSVDGLIFKVYTNAEARVLALLKGELDGAGSIPSTSIGSLIGQPNITVIKIPGTNVNNWLGYNLRVYPFNIRQVRQAIDYAVDKDFIYNQIEMSIAEHGSDGDITPAMTQWVDPNAPLWKGKGLTADQRYAAANALLDGLGFKVGADGVRVTPNGTRLEFELLAPTSPSDYVRCAEAIASDLANIGLKIDVKPLETDTVINIVYPSSGIPQYSMYIMGSGYDPDPDAVLYLEFFSNPPVPSWTADSEHYRNDTLNALLLQQRQEPNVTKRHALVDQIQELLADDLPYIPLFHRVGIQAHRTDKFVGWNDHEGVYSPLTALNLHLLTPPTPTTTTPQVQVATVTPSWVWVLSAVAILVVIASVGYALNLRRKSKA